MRRTSDFRPIAAVALALGLILASACARTERQRGRHIPRQEASARRAPERARPPVERQRPAEARQAEARGIGELEEPVQETTGLSPAQYDVMTEFADDPLLADESGSIPDPLKGWNLVWYHFNDKLYFWLLKPTAEGYRVLLPRPARMGVKNFFINLEMPIRSVNSLFQGRPGQAGEEVGRFLVNSTVGLLGFLDPATHWLEMDIHYRDTDQSLAKASMPQAMYLMWPMIGPSSIRGTLGEVGDAALDGATYLPGLGLVQVINTISLGEWKYEEAVEASIDPYVALRSGYVQYRSQKAEE